jgi:hypothetical protein
MNYGESSQEPLLKYSADCERASFIDDDEEQTKDLMPKKRGAKKGKKKSKRSRRQGQGGAKGVKLVKGKVSLRLEGLGIQKLGASELVRFISLSKLKVAAKKFLQSKGISKKRRKGRKQKR